MTSNCCGAPLLMSAEDHVCSECMEHCDPEPEETELTEEDRREQRGEWMMECERNGD